MTCTLNILHCGDCTQMIFLWWFFWIKIDLIWHLKTFLLKLAIESVLSVYYFLINLRGEFEGAFNGVNFKVLLEWKDKEFWENIKSSFCKKSRDLAYTTFKIAVAQVTLHLCGHFDLIYIIVKSVVFAFKIAIVWFLTKTMRGTSWKNVNFRRFGSIQKKIKMKVQDVNGDQ